MLRDPVQYVPGETTIVLRELRLRLLALSEYDSTVTHSYRWTRSSVVQSDSCDKCSEPSEGMIQV